MPTTRRHVLGISLSFQLPYPLINLIGRNSMKNTKFLPEKEAHNLIPLFLEVALLKYPLSHNLPS